MHFLKTIFLIITASLIYSCSQKESVKILIVKNTLDIARSNETIELTKDFLMVEDLGSIGIREAITSELQVCQLVDNDSDGVMDLLLFQPQVAANSENKFEVIILNDGDKEELANLCYSRFVPERMDDYTWENDRVAFRTFGPTAKKMAEENVAGGTLASGIDAWLKKVDYSIIDKWYKKDTDGTGSYHEDTGEGLDNFHVGASRGVGGIAVKNEGSYYFSDNFVKWKTIANGPIRTSFILEYAPWDAGGKMVTDSKTLSLDLGSNLTKYEISFDDLDQISVGLTLHEKDGQVTEDKSEGWLSYWQPHDISELGMAIVASPGIILDYEVYDVEDKDLSNAYALLKVNNNKVVYYAGFGWKESGQFSNAQEWENYLKNFSLKLNSPMEIEIRN